METRLLGYVSVDSGTLLICDPCYIDGKTVFDYEQDVVRHSFEKAPSRQLGSGSWGSSLLIGNWGGDGIFPVYAQINEKGSVRSVTIAFEEHLWDTETGRGVESIVQALRLGVAQ